MGIQTLIIGVAFLLFAIIFVVPVLSNIDNIAEDGLLCGAIGICLPEKIPTEETQRFIEEVKKQETEADKRLPSIVGKTVCDLTVEVKADLIDDFGKATIFIDKNTNPTDYQWHCDFKELSFLSNLSFLNDLSSLSIFAFEDEFIHTEIVLIQQSDKSKKYDANHEDYKEMYRDIRLTQTTGIIPTPYQMDQSFYIDNVVHDNYVLEVYYGKEINNLPVGEPYLDKVCKVGVNCQ
jgi:hypothetical protein